MMSSGRSSVAAADSVQAPDAEVQLELDRERVQERSLAWLCRESERNRRAQTDLLTPARFAKNWPVRRAVCGAQQFATDVDMLALCKGRAAFAQNSTPAGRRKSTELRTDVAAGQEKPTTNPSAPFTAGFASL